MTMNRIIAACIAVSACGAAISGPPVVTITRDGGGSISAYIARATELRAQGTPVRVTGECHSACAIIASLPTACIAKRGRVGLHWPYLPAAGGIALGPDVFNPFFDHVTPEIAAAVRALPFDYRNPGAVHLTVTAKTARKFGLTECKHG
jgi:hypothetical protein